MQRKPPDQHTSESSVLEATLANSPAAKPCSALAALEFALDSSATAFRACEWARVSGALSIALQVHGGAMTMVLGPGIGGWGVDVDVDVAERV